MQEKSTRRTNKSRTEETRSALISAARELFVEKGFAETGTPEIVKAAEITRGALYHHFKDKTDLFRAVIKSESLSVAKHIREMSAKASDPDALAEGTDAYFSAMAIPGRARLLLIEGPAVLGLKEMEEFDKIAGGEELRKGLEEALPENIKRIISVEALSEMLSAAFDRAALAISEGKDIDDYKNSLKLILESLLAR